MVDPEYALTWPRDLFESEVKSLRHLPDEDVRGAVALLLEEAYRDPKVAERFFEDTDGRHSPWDVGPSVRTWLLQLLQDNDRLRPYVQRKYYAERNKMLGDHPQRPGAPLSSAFVHLIDDLQGQGYFPRQMPRECNTNPTDYGRVTQSIRDDTLLTSVTWPIREPEASLLGDHIVYTLMEFFYDHTQRPRTYLIHAGCGRHFDGHNRQAGRAVYQWRVNDLLERYGVPLRLAHDGVEHGRLVQHFGSGLDALADAHAADDVEAPNATAEAVRLYRERDASLHQKRSALTLLAGELEPRRQTIKTTVMKKDEAALFELANSYAIRHHRADQHEDYGVEYLDWIFWNFLATVDLMSRLERRQA